MTWHDVIVVLGAEFAVGLVLASLRWRVADVIRLPRPPGERFRIVSDDEDDAVAV